MSIANMEKHLFSLKFAAKDLERQSKKSEKEEKAEKVKLKKAIAKGNMDGARIHAENSIRNKSQALNYLRMAARVDAVASRVQTAVTQRKVTQSMAGVVKNLDAAMKSMNLEKISALMDKFEHQFEDLDVQSSYMDTAMSQTTTTAVPQDAVNGLMAQVADEAGLELNMELPTGGTTTVGVSATQASQDQDELTQRLAKLRNAWFLQGGRLHSTLLPEEKPQQWWLFIPIVIAFLNQNSLVIIKQNWPLVRKFNVCHLDEYYLTMMALRQLETLYIRFIYKLNFLRFARFLGRLWNVYMEQKFYNWLKWWS